MSDEDLPKENASSEDQSETRAEHELVELLKERLPDEPVAPSRLAEILAEVVTVEVRKFQGPLPPPDVMLEYERAQPGLITLITDRAGKEQDFRHAMTRQVQDREDKKLFHLALKTYLGQGLAFILAITAIGGGIWLLANGHKSEGLGTIITAVATLAVVFVTGKITEAVTASKRQKND